MPAGKDINSMKWVNLLFTLMIVNMHWTATARSVTALRHRNNFPLKLKL